MKTKQFRKNKHAWVKILVLPFLLACLIGAKPQGKKTDIQTWTSLTGHQIVAEFVEIKGENLVLKDEDGVERVIRLPMLTSADQARAKELEKKRSKGDAQTAGSSSNRLPIFTAGPGKGSHAVYTHKNFIAKMDSKGSISVQCLEDGKPVGKPINVYFVCDYTEHRKYLTRAVTSYEKFPEPTLSPTVLEYEATLKGGLKCCFNFEFSDNTIQMWSWLINPKEITPASRSRLTVRFTPTHTFPVDMYVSEQKKILEPYTLVVNDNTKGVLRLPYGNSISGISSSAREMFVDGPLYGKRKVSVSVKSRNKTRITFYIYPKYAPYQGYSAFLRKNDETSKSDIERMILTID